MSRLGPLALLVSLFAALMAFSIWFSIVGVPLGAFAVVMGLAALRDARRRHERSPSAMAAVVLGTLAVLAFPFLLVACNESLSCV